MKDMNISDQYNKSSSNFKLHASLCVRKRMEGRAHASASKRERLLTGKSWISVKENIYYQ